MRPSSRKIPDMALPAVIRTWKICLLKATSTGNFRSSCHSIWRAPHSLTREITAKILENCGRNSVKMKLPYVNDTPKIHLQSLRSVNFIDAWQVYKYPSIWRNFCQNQVCKQKFMPANSYSVPYGNIHWFSFEIFKYTVRRSYLNNYSIRFYTTIVQIWMPHRVHKVFFFFWNIFFFFGLPL